MKFQALTVLILSLGACGAPTQLDDRSTAVQVTKTLGAPDSAEPAVDLSNYRLGPSDEIAVSVFGAPELDREGSIDAAGSFSLPLVGSISAAGKTPQELASAIQDKLRGPYLKDPSVTINVKEAKAQMVTVDGEVKVPGIYPVVGRMTLQQAIATAKGASQAAAIENVIVFRTVDGQKMAAMFNLKDIRSGRYADPAIYGNDIVVVGESATRRFFSDFAGFIPVVARFVPVL